MLYNLHTWSYGTLQVRPPRDVLRYVMGLGWGGEVTFMLSCTDEASLKMKGKKREHSNCKTHYMYECCWIPPGRSLGISKPCLDMIATPLWCHTIISKIAQPLARFPPCRVVYLWMASDSLGNHHVIISFHFSSATPKPSVLSKTATHCAAAVPAIDMEGVWIFCSSKASIA